MQCSASELCSKDVINTCNGMRIGSIDDVKLDCQTGKIISLTISGRNGVFGMGKCDDICIPWENIEVIGNDTILVKCPDINPKPVKHGLENLFK